MTEAKKKWQVRSWAQVEELNDLEDLLNELADTDYRVYQLIFERRVVVAYHVEPRVNSLTSLLGSLVQPTVVKVESGSSDDDSGHGQHEDLEHKGALTMNFIEYVNDIMEARKSGDTHIRERVESAIHTIFAKASTHEAAMTLNDMQSYLTQHVKVVVNNGNVPCGDECPVNFVLKTVEDTLKNFLAANPTS